MMVTSGRLELFQYLILIALGHLIIVPKELIRIELILSILIGDHVDLLIVKLINIFKSESIFDHHIFNLLSFSFLGLY